MRFVLLRAKQAVEKFEKRTTITYRCFAPRSILSYTAAQNVRHDTSRCDAADQRFCTRRWRLP